jgi:lysine 6-dehydrogenase
MQGTAAAYDLITHGGASMLTLVDANEKQLRQSEARLRELTKFEGLKAQVIDASTRKDELRKLFEKADICMNCLPYRLSLSMTELALDTNTHYLDLGGNTEIVRKQLYMAAEHPNGKTLSVLPDCGLAPGMGNLFAAHALKVLGNCESISVRCGGLPQNPKPPLDYMLVFSVEGLTNEYFGQATVLREGTLQFINTFSELEPIFFDGLSECEAFVTSGGTSTAPWSFQKRVRNFDYKTIRYKGHYQKFKVLLDLGLLDLSPITVAGQDIIPRHVLHQLLKEKVSFPGERDLAVLRCTAVDAARERTLTLEIHERFDPHTEFTAMERTTAFSATACAHAIAEGKARTGAFPLEESIDTEWFITALQKRGIAVKVVESKLGI